MINTAFQRLQANGKGKAKQDDSGSASKWRRNMYYDSNESWISAYMGHRDQPTTAAAVGGFDRDKIFRKHI